MTHPTGWTAADEAELGVLIWAWIDEATEHERAHGCAGDHTCHAINQGVQVLLDWYRARCRLSLAEYLRARQNELERAA